MTKRYLHIAAACALAAAIAGCSSGSGGTGPLPVPSAAPTLVPASNAQFVVHIPGLAPGSSQTLASRGTRPMDFSASTQSVKIAIGTQVLATADVSAGSKLCSSSSGGGRTCTIGVNAPAGNDTFTITAFDQPNGGGNAIATASVQAAISSQPATVNVAVTGSVVKLAVALSNPYPPVGTAATVNVIVTGTDADGNLVLGPYSSPVTLKNSDTSGATTLSATSVSDSSANVTLTYNGSQPYVSSTITATLPGVGSATATFAPTPAFVKAYQFADVPGMRFPMGPGPWNIARGPDGNMWVAATGYAEVFKITPDGGMTAYPVSVPYAQLQGIVLGSDGNLWFAEQGNNAIGKITTAGAITEYPLPQQVATPNCVALGADGNVWFADNYNGLLGKITPSGTVTEFPLPAKSSINNIATGPDGALWMSDIGNNAILKASTSGQVLASYAIPSAGANPYGLAAGPDGNIWFTEFGTGKIGRVTPSGTFAEFDIPSGSAGPIAITAGPDGRMWFAEMGQEAGLGKIGYITTDGKQIRDFFKDGYHVHDLTFDAHGTLWYVADQLPFGNQEVGTFAY